MLLAEETILIDFKENILHYYVQFENILVEYYRLKNTPNVNQHLLQENLVKQYTLLNAIELLESAATRDKLPNIEKKILHHFIEKKTRLIEEALLPEITLFIMNKYGKFIDAQQLIDIELIKKKVRSHCEADELSTYLQQYQYFILQGPFEYSQVMQYATEDQSSYFQAICFLLQSLQAKDDVQFVHLVTKKIGIPVSEQDFFSEDVRSFTSKIGKVGAASLLLDTLLFHRFIVSDVALQRSLFQFVHILGLKKQDIEKIVTIMNAVKLEQYEVAATLKNELGKFEQLDIYIKHVQMNGGDLYRPFMKALVVGTMSSGKSTFLNGIIGKDLFPSKNEACTAKIFEYTCRTDLQHYYAKYDETNYTYYDDLTEDSFTQWNNRDDIEHIHIQGPITSVFNFSKKLAFLDTPGPNNSMDASHAAMMEQAMRCPFQKIIYVINGTQLATDDDRFLLIKIADFMKANPQVELLFIVNKVDEFDNNENESVHHLKENVLTYLQANGFHQPMVMFTSALACKLALKHLAGESLTRRERNLLAFYEDLLTTQNMNFEQLSSPISQYDQNTVRYNVEQLSLQHPDSQKMLQIVKHSGILHALKSI